MGKRLAAVGTAICVAAVLACGSVVAQQFTFPAGQQTNLFGYAQPQGPNMGLIVADIIAAVLGFAIGAFFSPLLAPYRRYALIGGLILAVLYSWLSYGFFAQMLGGFISIVIFVVALLYGLRLGVLALSKSFFHLDDPTSFGTAKWATHAYLATHKMFTGQGFLLGEFDMAAGPKTPLRYAGDRHLLTVAPTPHSFEKYSAVCSSRLPKYWITPELLMKVGGPP